jgi:hypothetical protein
MRIIRQPSKPEQGNTLLLVLILAGVAITVLATALSLANHRNLIAARASAWNSALPVAEAGIEEALTQIQWSNGPVNGWTLTNGFYVKTRLNPFTGVSVAGNADSYYTVAITPTNPPIITSAGYVSAPLQGSYIHRTVQVTTRSPGRFPYGVLAKENITISGGSQLDSFNSSDPAYSTGGMYDTNKAEANCKVVTNSGANNALQVGTGTIYGSVATGPGSSTFSVGSSGCVGDTGYVNNTLDHGTVQPGHSATNMNISIPDVQVPYTSGVAVTSGSNYLSGTTYKYALGSSNYYVSGSFTISDSSSAMVVTNAATLYVTGDFTIQGSGYVYIAPGGSLNLYVGTTNASGNNKITISGGGIANGTGLAANFSVNGLPSVQTATYSGSSEFIGTSYTPEASLTISGSSDCVGAFVADNVTLSGGMNVHYDEALGGGLGLLKYAITTWREL